MEEYKMIFQIIAFVFIIVILYYVYRSIIYSYRYNRLDSFTLKSKKKDIVFNYIDKIAKKLMKYDFYKKRVSKYEKYFNSKSKYKSIHVITIKIITGLLLAIIYLFDCMLFKLNLNLLILIIMYIVGYYIVDIIFNIEYSSKVLRMDNNLTRVMIVMNNNYRVNKNHKEVIDSVIEEMEEPLKSEFILVRNDLNKGLDISTALYRMYERTNLDKVLYMSELLALNIKYGISVIDICDTLEKDITRREKRDFYLLRLKNTNKLVIILLAIIPLFVIGLLMIMNYDYLILLQLNRKLFLVIGELIAYLFYLFIMLSMIRGEL